MDGGAGTHRRPRTRQTLDLTEATLLVIPSPKEYLMLREIPSWLV